MLAVCLRKLAPGQQTIPPDQYEVIVTDDGSRSTAEEMMKAEFPWARWTAGPRRGPAANRNNGAKVATGEWVIFTDDDCVPDSSWLASLLLAANDAKVDVVEGLTTTPGFRQSLLWEGIQNPRGGNLWSCNLAVKSGLFRRLGGFDEDFRDPAHEDSELAFRLKRDAGKIVFQREMLVVHPPRRVGWKGLWRRTKMGRWDRLYALKTGKIPAEERSCWAIFPGLLWNYVLDAARIGWQVVTNRHREQNLRMGYWVAWRLLILPFMAPYLAVWESRFRHQMATKSKR